MEFDKRPPQDQDLGKTIATGYLVSVSKPEEVDGHPKIVSVQGGELHENAIVLNGQAIDGDTLSLMGITNPFDKRISLALDGDSGRQPTSAGYTPKYAANFNMAFKGGSSNN